MHSVRCTIYAVVAVEHNIRAQYLLFTFQLESDIIIKYFTLPRILQPLTPSSLIEVHI